tara:strand:+ start:1406 stop:1741 length:336 start_codon:yes stop_codon:yes gene_type:complete
METEMEKLELKKLNWNMRGLTETDLQPSEAELQQSKMYKHCRMLVAKNKPLLEAVKCDCGNTIKLFNRKDDFKCFSCNFFWDRDRQGNWIKSNHKANKHQLTLGSIPIKQR